MGRQKYPKIAATQRPSPSHNLRRLSPLRTRLAILRGGAGGEQQAGKQSQASTHRRRSRRSRPVMKPDLRNQNASFHRSIDEAMFGVDAARPVTAKRVLQWFGLPDARVWTADDVLQELVDPRHHLGARSLPESVILPRLRRKSQVHAPRSISRATPSPLSSAWMASSSRRAFAGLRMR